MDVIILFSIVIFIPFIVALIMRHKHNEELRNEAINKEFHRQAKVAALYGDDLYEGTVKKSNADTR
jgi:uncharacterized membrane protein